MLRLIAVAAFTLLIGSAPHNLGRVDRGKSLCDLYKRGASSSGSFVKFRGVIITDLYEHSALIDPDCERIPFSFVLPQEFYHQQTAFMTALYGDMNDLSLRRMEVVATGKFVWDQGKSPPATIYIDEVLKFRRLGR
ncbi:MAG TPA: hypothetical protein VFW19_01170 [Allosphingosinicella sp.]|nr:hypothetical protein [Allosphingosinicella sp.]